MLERDNGDCFIKVIKSNHFFLKYFACKTLNTDKHTAYGYAIARLIKEGKLRADVKQRQITTLNNRIESDHAPIKKLIVATGGLKSAKLAWSTIQEFETLRKLNKGQFDDWLRHDEPRFRVRERSAFMN